MLICNNFDPKNGLHLIYQVEIKDLICGISQIIKHVLRIVLYTHTYINIYVIYLLAFCVPEVCLRISKMQKLCKVLRNSCKGKKLLLNIHANIFNNWIN